MNLLNELQAFSGSEKFYEYSPLGSKVFIYTEGIKHLAEAGDCYWLLDIVASYQGSKALKGEEFQVWELYVSDEQTAVVKCQDGNDNYLITQKIPYTDIPLKNQTLKLYLTNGTLMLTDEY